MARALGGLEHGLDRLLARAEVGREAAFVADSQSTGRARAAGALSEWKTSAPIRSASAKRVRAGGHEHELLQVDRVLGVGAAVDHVQHRHRQRARLFAAEVAGRARRPRRPRPPLPPPARRRGSRSRPDGPCWGCRRARSAARRAPAGRRRRGPCSAAAISPRTFSTACETPLPPQGSPPSRSSSASWTPVEAPEGTAARPTRARLEHDVGLDGRVSARVEDLPRVNCRDRRHRRPPLRGRK